MNTPDSAADRSAGSPPFTDDGPRYAGLRDYIRVLRSSWWLLVLLTVLAAGAAYALSKRQQPVYQAFATISYADQTYALSLLGTSLAPSSAPPAQGLPARALKVTSPDVVAAVDRALGGRIPRGIVQSSVVATVDQKTGLVDVIGTAHQGYLAARLADLFATNAAALTNSDTRARFTAAVQTLSTELAHVVGRSIDASDTRAALISQISRLSFLASTANPAEVVTYAPVPGSPVSPRTGRNTLLAGAAGLLLALVLAFGRDILDRRLRGSQQVESALRLAVLGRIRAGALGQPVRIGAPSAGKSKTTPADAEAVRIVRQNLARLASGSAPRVVLVTSAVPEEGKSTVAASLAFAYAAAGSRTLLVECDLRRPTLAKRLGLQPGPGLADHLAGEATAAEIVQRIELPAATAPVNGSGPPAGHDPVRSLACVTAGALPAAPAELLESERRRAFVSAAAAEYDVVLLDSSPLLVVADSLALLPDVDGVVLCVRSATTTREQASAARAVLDRFPRVAAGVVVTGVHARDEGDAYAYAYAARA